MLWSDPADDKKARSTKWKENPKRNCSYFYGYEPLKKFLIGNNFTSMIRAHEVQADGYKFHRWGGDKSFPIAITIFSAPNYGGKYGNKGAICLYEQGKIGIKQYKEVPRPYQLPGEIDLF